MSNICEDCPLAGLPYAESGYAWAVYGVEGDLSLTEMNESLKFRFNMLAGICKNVQMSEEQLLSEAGRLVEFIADNPSSSKIAQQELFSLPTKYRVHVAAELFRIDDTAEYRQYTLDERRTHARKKYAVTMGFSPEEIAAVWEEISPSED